jgi:ABC-2 type transport system ATP-binding protein
MILAENVTVEFRKGVGRHRLRALDDLTIEIREGDFFALLGENGAGKSTAMYCLLGLLRPTAGRVTIRGESPRLGGPVYQDVGYLPEEPHYPGFLTVEEAVTYYARLSGSAAAAGRIGELLDWLGLAEFRRMRVDKCSKGMKQKIGMVQCLLHEPKVLFLDEPMRGLDPLAVRQFRDRLVKLNRSGVTIVMNSHILSEVEMVASRAAILRRGKLIADGLVTDLRSPGASYTVEYRGPEPPEFVSAHAARDGIRTVTVPADRLYEFLDFARGAGVELFSCAREKTTLEDYFVDMVGKPDDA